MANGIKKEYILKSIKHGIAKINIATAIRQPYEVKMTARYKTHRMLFYDTVAKL